MNQWVNWTACDEFCILIAICEIGARGGSRCKSELSLESMSIGFDKAVPKSPTTADLSPYHTLYGVRSNDGSRINIVARFQFIVHWAGEDTPWTHTTYATANGGGERAAEYHRHIHSLFRAQSEGPTVQVLLDLCVSFSSFVTCIKAILQYAWILAISCLSCNYHLSFCFLKDLLALAMLFRTFTNLKYTDRTRSPVVQLFNILFGIVMPPTELILLISFE